MDVQATHASIAELERIGDEIAELSAHLDAASARLLDLIRDFDARGGWNTGFRSCAEWLSWRVGLDLGAAREKVRVARALPALPRLAQALARGELSYAKVRALTRVATPDDRGAAARPSAAPAPPSTSSASSAAGAGWIARRRRDETTPAAREPSAPRVSGRRRHRDDPRAPVARGRRAPPESADGGPRGAVPAGSGLSSRRAQPDGRFRGNADDGSAASRRAAAPRRDRAPPRDRSGHAGRALPGGGPCRRRGPGRIRISPASPSSKTARAFPRKRPSAWRATRAGW